MRSVKFDAVAVGELTVSLLDESPSVTAKLAFVDRSSGKTHGWTTCRQWSPETLRLLRELCRSMEKDAEFMHFADAESPTGSGHTPTGSVPLASAFKGLGETLGTSAEDVPQT